MALTSHIWYGGRSEVALRDLAMAACPGALCVRRLSVWIFPCQVARADGAEWIEAYRHRAR